MSRRWEVPSLWLSSRRAPRARAHLPLPRGRPPRRPPPRRRPPRAARSTPAVRRSSTPSSRPPSQAFKSTNPSITVNYTAWARAPAAANLYANTVLFAGRTRPSRPREQSKVPAGKTVLYFPILIGPITVTYNLPNVSNLKLDGTVLANIFSGKITTWNDPAIKALNSGANLPSTPITLAVRSDSSGTTQNFALYLRKPGAAPGRSATAPPSSGRPRPTPPRQQRRGHDRQVDGRRDRL